MKRRVLFVLWSGLLVVVFAGATSAVAALGKISDGIYAYVGEKSGSPNNRFGVNAGIIIGDEGVLVVDTMTSAKEAEAFFQDIRKITDKPILYVVDTHYHLDHAFGNSIFKEEGGKIISQVNCRKQMLQVKDSALENAKSFGMDDVALEGTRIVIPDLGFDRIMELDLGNREVHLLASGFPSHTAGSIIVWVPAQKVAFAGDILFTDFHPYLAEGDLDGWAKTLDFLQTLGAEKIIPGHGPLSGSKEITDMKEYLQIFDRNARELCAASKNVEEIAAEMVEVLPPRSDGQFLIAANILGKYLSLAGQAKQ